MRRGRLFLLLLAIALCTASAAWLARAFQPRGATEATLAGYAPEGALLTVESPDFHTLLTAWTQSDEARRWAASDSYASFANSNLFGRLADAQKQFAASAGLNPDGGSLAQVAGDQSLLAWYGIGDLRMLYITHMAPGAAERTPLFALRSRFETRRVGDWTFYVRSQGDPARTVAFAAHGDYLLLATDETLLAGALKLLAGSGERTVAEEHWYASATAAAGRPAGDLRMTLNLTALTASPYFRSYWVQRNVSAMKLYRAAVTDLDRMPDSLREQRVLLPAVPAATPEQGADVELGGVLAYLLPDTGVWRATAEPAPEAVLAQLEDKLLTRGVSRFVDPADAPEADLSVPAAGAAGDLDERIDAPPPVTSTRSEELAGLSALLTQIRPRAMLVYSTAADPGRGAGADGSALFRQIHSAVVVESDSPWPQAALEAGLLRALSSRLTVGQAGLSWQTRRQGKMEYRQMSGLAGLVLSLQGNMLVLASDEATLLALGDRASTAKPVRMTASVFAGFAHAAERGPMLRLVQTLDPPRPAGAKPSGAPPAFFSDEMGGLSETFRGLDLETFKETTAEDHTVHQTVTYTLKSKTD